MILDQVTLAATETLFLLSNAIASVRFQVGEVDIS